jgi:CRISPR/Cas system-associated exonuclease Cas4 (RecB family)
MATLMQQFLEDGKQKRLNENKMLPLIEQIYSGYLTEDSWRKKESFAPSGLVYGSGACARRWYLSFTGTLHESKATPLNVANMSQGTASHERIQKAMRNSGVAKDIERPVRHSDPPIFGFADAIILWNGTLYVGEIKTTSQTAWEYRKKTGRAADYHLAQILMYMYILEIPNGVLIYESKDTQELHAIEVEMDDAGRELVERILDWCRRVYQAYKDGKVPERSFRKDSKVCKSCPVEKACLENSEPTTIKFERLDIKR